MPQPALTRGMTVELSEFIERTLVDIQKGVAAAIRSAAEIGGVINPVFGGINDIGMEHRQDVVFDVAVTVSEKSSKSGSGGVEVAVLRAGIDGSQAEENSRVSRIQFTIPIIPSVQIVAPDPNAPPKATVGTPAA